MNEEWIECAGDVWLRAGAIVRVNKCGEHFQDPATRFTWVASVGEAESMFITEADAMRIIGKDQPAIRHLARASLSAKAESVPALEIGALALMLIGLAAASSTLAQFIVGSFKR